MISKISEGVTISVETFYQPEYSNPITSEFMFAYRITIENNNLSLKIINGIPAGIDADTRINDESMINIQKRLNLLYPGRHELKINAEQELLMIHLNLKLEETTQTEQNITEPSKPVLTYA